MSYRHWMPHIAARGCLIAAILVFPIGLHSQESTPESGAPIEEGQGVSLDAPAPQEGGQEQPAEKQTPAGNAAPGVLAIQKQRPAEPACDARCQAAEQRENDDLVAQRSMAASTEDLVGLTFWQISIGAVGAFLLIGTLLLMIQANKAAIHAAKSAEISAEAAQAAVAVAQDTAKHELRAYVVVELLKLDRYRNASVLGKKGDWFSIRAQFKNVGKTPALCSKRTLDPLKISRAIS